MDGIGAGLLMMVFIALAVTVPRLDDYFKPDRPRSTSRSLRTLAQLFDSDNYRPEARPLLLTVRTLTATWFAGLALWAFLAW